MTREFDSNTPHKIYYETEGNRQYWECQTCSSGGSVGEFGDPEAAAEKSHAQRGIYHLVTTNKRFGE